MMRSGAVPVRACIDSPTCATGELAGSPRSVNVTYTVGSPVQQDAVLPHVVAQNAGGMVVIRGSGLAGVTSVGFGGNAGGTPTVRNDTGDRQSPAARARHVRGAAQHRHDPVHRLARGRGKPVVHGAGACVSRNAERGCGARVRRRATGLARRAALRRPERESRPSLHVRRLAWGTPASFAFPRVRDIALSNRGDRVLVLSNIELVESDPVTLAMIDPATHQALVGATRFMRNLALANDGHAVVTTDLGGTGALDVYLYSLGTHRGSFAASDAAVRLVAASGACRSRNADRGRNA